MAAKYGKHTRAIALTASAAVLLTIGSTMAYFSSADEVTNSFSSSKLGIMLSEPAWKSTNGKNVVPGDVLPKDPVITNEEGVPAYVFMRVTVPCGKPEIEHDTDVDTEEDKHGKGDVRTEKGTAQKDYPIYKFMVGDTYDDTDTAAQKVNTSCWKLLTDYPKSENGSMVYVYAYTDTSGGLRVMKKGETTEKPLFDKIRVSNFDESYVPTGDQSVLVEALGIQSEHLGTEQATPEAVWGILARG